VGKRGFNVWVSGRPFLQGGKAFRSKEEEGIGREPAAGDQRGLLRAGHLAFSLSRKKREGDVSACKKKKKGVRPEASARWDIDFRKKEEEVFLEGGKEKEGGFSVAARDDAHHRIGRGGVPDASEKKPASLT